MSDELASRTTSCFPLSIGTGEALATIFKPTSAAIDETKTRQTADIKNYDELWIGLSTLYRNIIASVRPSNQKDLPEEMTKDSPSRLDYLRQLSTNDIVSTMLQELSVINTVIQEQAPQIKLVVYMTDLDLKTLPSWVKLRTTNSAISKYENDVFRSILEIIYAQTDEIVRFKNKIKPKVARTRAIILTHQPYELLAHKEFGKLDLLESHTGTVKPVFRWNSKYKVFKKQDMSHLPWHALLLYTFGDSKLFNPVEAGYLDYLYSVSIQKGWTPVTTDDKIKLDLDLSRTALVASKWNPEYQKYLSL